MSDESFKLQESSGNHKVGYDQHKECDRRNDATIAKLRAELSALRAAQPLTREGIDAVLEKERLGFIGRGALTKDDINVATYGMSSLRDALLDSLAEPK